MLRLHAHMILMPPPPHTRPMQAAHASQAPAGQRACAGATANTRGAANGDSGGTGSTAHDIMNTSMSLGGLFNMEVRSTAFCAGYASA